jgi:DNA-binding XRE family transcriptional regulator
MSAVAKSERIVEIPKYVKVKTSRPRKRLSLKEVRVLLGLTIVEMADRLRTTRSTYWFWEQGLRNMPEKFHPTIHALLAAHSKQGKQRGVEEDAHETAKRN